METNMKKATVKSIGKSGAGVAGKTANAEKNPANSAKHEAVLKSDEAGLDEVIRQRAYFIWEAGGRKHGRDVEIWLQAKKEVLAQLKKVS